MFISLNPLYHFFSLGAPPAIVKKPSKMKKLFKTVFGLNKKQPVEVPAPLDATSDVMPYQIL